MTGTTRIVDIVPGAAGSDLYYGISFGSFATFRKDPDIYATNGTGAGTRLIFRRGDVYNIDGRAILVQNQFSPPDSVFLYDYANNQRTFLSVLPQGVGAIPPVTASFSDFFVISFGSDILISNGTQQGSFVISQAAGQSIGFAKEFVLFDGRIYFAAGTAATGTELFSIDPQARAGIAPMPFTISTRPIWAASAGITGATHYWTMKACSKRYPA